MGRKESQQTRKFLDNAAALLLAKRNPERLPISRRTQFPVLSTESKEQKTVAITLEISLILEIERAS